MNRLAIEPENRKGFLDLVEWAGNKLPEPVTLFVIGTVVVMLLSHVGTKAGWSVQPVRPKTQVVGGGTAGDSAQQRKVEIVNDAITGRPLLEPHGDPIRPVSLLSTDGLYWVIANLVKNFVEFPPLGIILTGMLGVGFAERVGLIGVMLKALMLIVPRPLLTPTILFLGVNSSLASDAGYIVLPPVAAALYLAAGRSPLVGIAAAFAGIAGGFSANLLLTASDAVMAGFSTTAAQILDPKYSVAPTCNWYFLIGSTFLLTFVGWAVTSWFIEPRLTRKLREENAFVVASGNDLLSQQLTPEEKRGLLISGFVYAMVLALILAAILIPGGPLHGNDPTDPKRYRWVQAIIPIILVSFLIPGIVYGICVGSIRTEKHVLKGMVESMASMASVIVLSFFAAQFIKAFDYSNLGKMLAMIGGQALARSSLSTPLMLGVFMLVSMFINLFISSATATYTLLLRRTDTPADTIVIRDKTPKSLKPTAATQSPAGPSPNHIRAMKAMLIAMASDRVPADIRVEET
ncbi:MAG: AbgT family transporter, partial [Planctomycetota bacterium]